MLPQSKMLSMLQTTAIAIATLFLANAAPAAPPQPDQKIESPAINALREKLAQDPHALDSFWQQIEKSGSPLIETIAASNESLVTFLWRGDASTKNVVVISPLALVNLQDAKMTQLPATNLWYLTYRMRNDARMAYRFSPNDSLVPFEAETNFFARMSNFQRDPFNPKTFDYGGNMKASVLELPGAPSDQSIHARPEIPHGTLKESKFASAILKNDRSLWLYTPPAYDPARSYSLLVLMDGDSYTTLVPTPVILDNLIHDGKIPPVVALFIGNASPQARDSELNCAPAWSDFLTKEAIPWIESAQHVRTEPSGVLIAGSSMGGLAAACAAVDHPEVFSKVLAQSGSFYRAPAGEEPESLARRLAQSTPLPLAFYLEIGLLETSAIPNRDPSMLTASRHLRDVLIARGYHIEFHDRYSGHEHVAWRATLCGGLVALLASPPTTRRKVQF
ncbi:MAG: alpha/beta hydrolase-fold protein [Candidatus Acidiferrales bacterium]